MTFRGRLMALVWLASISPRGALAGEAPRPGASLVEATTSPRLSGGFRLADVASGCEISVRYPALGDADRAELEQGARYDAPGASVWLARLERGVEDFVLLEAPPPRPELRYEVELGGRIAGLRLVEQTLEFLDPSGAPALRVAAPWGVDAAGSPLRLRLHVEGCAVSLDPAPPWGMPPVDPRARRCAVVVSWDDDEGRDPARYPALIDPAWSSGKAMASHHVSHGAVALKDGKILVVAGYLRDTVEIFHPPSSTWATQAKLPISGRIGPAVHLLPDGSVLVAGGLSDPPGGQPQPAASRFDPKAGVWSPVPSMSVARAEMVSVTLADGRVLVAGGQGPEAASSAEIYDPISNSWAPTGNPLQGRKQAAAALLEGGDVLVLGGRSTSNTVLSTAEIFHPQTDSWTYVSQLTTGRYNHTATLLPGGDVLIAGGENGKTSWERYQPDGDVWVGYGDLPAAQSGHTASLLPNGWVLLAGGSTFAQTAQAYRAATGEFKPQPGLITGRQSHRATLLPDGRLLVTGGDGAGTNNHLTSTEIFGLLDGQGPCDDDAPCVAGVCAANSCAPAGGAGGAGQGGQAGAGSGGSAQGGAGQGGSGGSDAGGAGSGGSAQGGASGQAGAGGQAPVTPCAGASECPGGHCVDGFCCDAPCAGVCEACSAAKKGGGQDGVCGPIAEGLDPEDECAATASESCGTTGVCDGAGQCQRHAAGTPCGAICTAAILKRLSCDGQGQCSQVTGLPCAPYACAGVEACATSCEGPQGCSQGQCQAGACVGAGKGLGEPCSGGGGCASGKCVDGVCCNEGCEGACRSCLAKKKGGGDDGVCGPVAAGTDPDDECPQASDFPDSCGPPGLCDGAGACQAKAAAGTPCGATSCAGAVAQGLLCNKAGQCVAGFSGCAPFVCAGPACGQSCASAADCAAGAFCNGLTSKCQRKQPGGGECGADEACESGHCADGVCCDTACNGQCEACDVPGSAGKCSAVTGAPRGGRKPCKGSGLCAGACDGVVGASCSYPGPSQLCELTSCASAVRRPWSCDGAGACLEAPSQPCAPYGCDGAGKACKTSCSADGDCASGAVCDVDKKQCALVGASCVDPYTLRTAEGKEQSCAPYRCLGGSCLATCAQPADCAQGFICAAGKCAAGAAGAAGSGGQGGAVGAPAPAPALKDEGCGCRAAGAPPASGLPLAALLALATLGRRARPRQGDRRGRLTPSSGP